MPQNITDVDEFTDPVQVPQDGEAATGASQLLGAQDLSNRTRYLKLRQDNLTTRVTALEAAGHFGRYFVSGLGVAQGSKFTLTQAAASGLTLATNEVSIVAAGLYIVILSGSFTLDTAIDPDYPAIGIQIDAVDVARVTTTQPDRTGVHPYSLACSFVGTLSAGQKVKAVSRLNNMSAYALLDDSERPQLCISRVA